MKLLLLLSALLSALTGVVGGARGVEVPAYQARVVTTRVAVSPAAVPTPPPVAVARLRKLSSVPLPTAFDPPPPVPRYAGRRRE